MDENKIRSIVRQEIASKTSGSRFGFGATQRHIHNNIDAPYVFQPILEYVGYINGNGLPFLLPSGWTAVSSLAGFYTITHTLPTTARYVVNATPVDVGTAVFIVTGGSPAAPNDITFTVYNSGGGLLANPFYFTLTVINNKSQDVPTYQGTLVS